MHVIAKPTLIDFWSMHPDAQGPLQAWLALMQNSSFASFDELRRVFARADRVAGLTVFDTGGNKYRLIAAIHYNRGKVYVRHVLTHTDYDRGTWKGRNR